MDMTSKDIETVINKIEASKIFTQTEKDFLLPLVENKYTYRTIYENTQKHGITKKQLYDMFRL